MGVDALLTGKNFGRYEIRSKLGSGGMGEVYAAHDTQLDRAVALKILSAEFTIDQTRRSWFHREARAVSALNHPHILTIYEIGETEQGAFMATELVDGETLRQVIKSRSLSLIQILKITEQIASALAAAHEAHIVHRDIKPENIMIRRDGYVKVLDFGLAKPMAQAADSGIDDSAVKTMPGMIIGSVRYMSPEQACGQKVDERTDIWSLGVVMFEMLSGKAPFDRATTSETLGAVIYQDPESILDYLPNLPAELQNIIAKALEKDRERRYQQIVDLALDVKNLLYNIEHESSLERRQLMLSPRNDISENPTEIHQTASARRSTNSGVPSSASTVRETAPHQWRRWLALAGVCAAILLAAGFGLYHWASKGKNPMVANFERIKVSRLNSDGKVRLPAISPDGKYIAYSSGEVGNRSLVVRQLATDSEVTVVPPNAQGFATITFSPSGDYVFYTQTSRDYSLNTLYQVPTLGGTPKQLVEDVDSKPTFSPDGKRLVFLRHVSNQGQDVIYATNIDGSNIAQVIGRKQTEFDFFTAPAWSPDGANILVGAGKSQGGVSGGIVILEVAVANGSFKVLSPRKWNSIDSIVWFTDRSGFLLVGNQNDSAPAQLWRVAYPSGTPQAITNDANSYAGLAMSADGASIITLKSDPVSSIWSYSPLTKQATQLIADSPKLEGGSGLTQTPAGQLVYSSDEGFEKNLWLSDLHGENARRLTSEAKINQSPAITPDGRYIVFNSSRSGTFRIWRMDSDGKNPVKLSEEISEASDFNPVITSDGKTVIFNRSYIGDNHPSVVLRVSVEGGPVVTVCSDAQHSNFGAQISGDGKHLAYTSYDIGAIERKILIASFDGSVAGAIEKSFGSNLVNTVKWSPDGESLTYLSGEGIPNLWKLPLGGSGPVPLTNFTSGNIFNYSWSSDGKNLLIVRGIVNNNLVLIQDAARISGS